jgi:hypothetical protein
MQSKNNQICRTHAQNCARAKEANVQNDLKTGAKAETHHQKPKRTTQAGINKNKEYNGRKSIGSSKHANDDSKPSTRQTIPANLKHQIQLRDKGQCTYINTHGRRCLSRRFLEIHHIKPVSQGGNHQLKNLTLLCSGHHKVVHRRG